MPDRPQKRQRRGGGSASGRGGGKKKPSTTTNKPRQHSQKDSSRPRTKASLRAAAVASSLGPPLQGNEYLGLFEEQSRSFPPDMSRILDPELPGGDERREELFDMIDADAALKYAWAVPDDRALRVRA